ncbi:MAG: hypothetical protein P8O91_00630 [Luminiphilus sp.]|nr:hypothetical protein [Luminiphilus sp.]
MLESTPTVICILGMHRSGTSCLTGSLEESGVDLGERHTWNPHNIKGNRENQAIVDLNDLVLASNAAAWDQPRHLVRWSAEQLKEARRLVTPVTASKCVAFKDPRTLLTLDGWVQAVPELRFIGIYRHPMHVAQSLNNRSGMPIDAGLDLWYRYNQRLWRHYCRRKFPVLCFDDEEALFKKKLKNILIDFGLYDGDKKIEFYEAGLRTASADGSYKLARRFLRLLKKLKTIAE